MSSEPTKVINTVLADMYCTNTCTGIETPTFHIGLNIGRIGQFRVYQSISSVPTGIEKSFFLFFIVL